MYIFEKRRRSENRSYCSLLPDTQKKKKSIPGPCQYHIDLQCWNKLASWCSQFRACPFRGDASARRPRWRGSTVSYGYNGVLKRGDSSVQSAQLWLIGIKLRGAHSNQNRSICKPLAAAALPYRGERLFGFNSLELGRNRQRVII
jgi:hypothetical protein